MKPYDAARDIIDTTTKIAGNPPVTIEGETTAQAMSRSDHVAHRWFGANPQFAYLGYEFGGALFQFRRRKGK